MTLDASLSTFTWWTLLLLLGVNPALWSTIALVRFGHERLGRLGKPASPPKRPLTPADVAVLIPAHNEEVCIRATLESAARLVPTENIHVIADGCTDRTVEIARAFGANVLELNPSRGKAGGIEAAVEHFRFAERFVGLLITDADTELAPDYLVHALRHLEDPGTAAVAGYAYSSWQPQNLSMIGRFLIAYRVRLYAVMQFLKYGQTWRYTNVAPIVPGFASMYRTSLLTQMDLNPKGLVIEDFNMTFELHRKRLGRIAFGMRSYATAQDPDNLRDYYKQITRWSLGFWQTLRRHGFWWSGFSLALGLFLAEVLVASTVMLTMAIGTVLAAFAPLVPGAPTWFSGPVMVAAAMLDPLKVFLFVAIPDYLLTVVVAIGMRRPSLLVYGAGFLFIRIIDSTSMFWSLYKLTRTRSNGRWASPTRRAVDLAPAPALSSAPTGTASAAVLEAVEPGIVDDVALASSTRLAVRQAAPVVRDGLLVAMTCAGVALLVALVNVPVPAVMAACVIGLVLLVAALGRSGRHSTRRRRMRELLIRWTRTPRGTGPGEAARVEAASGEAAVAPAQVGDRPIAGAAAAPSVGAPAAPVVDRQAAAREWRPSPWPRSGADGPRPTPRPRPTPTPRPRPSPPSPRPRAPHDVRPFVTAPREGTIMQDIVIVGGGMASASVLIRLAAATAPPAAARITLVDPSGETGGGAAYHRNVHPALLLNDPVARIDRTGIGFGRWIMDRRDALLEELGRFGDPRVARWRADYAGAVKAGDVAPLFVPRRWFGEYIRERFAQAASALQLLDTTVTVRTATATTIERRGDVWRIGLDDAAEPLTARAVLLATGGPRQPDVVGQPGYLSGTPSLDLKDVERALTERPGADLLILGSAASAVEMVYCLEGQDDVGRVVVVSPSGRLPDGLRSTDSSAAPFQPRPELREARTADALLAALAAEVAAARAVGFTIPDVYPTLHGHFLTAFGAMSEVEKRRVVDVYSRTYLTLLRKTSSVYAQGVRRLAERGGLTLVSGQVSGVTGDADGFSVEMVDGRRFTGQVVLDCRGFGRPDTDPLLRGMLDGGTITLNDSGRGVRVGPGFEAAPGLAVLGPLLAGTAQDGEYVWHLEDIPRIWAYADRVVATLQKRLSKAASEDAVTGTA